MEVTFAAHLVSPKTNIEKSGLPIDQLVWLDRDFLCPTALWCFVSHQLLVLVLCLFDARITRDCP